MASKVSICNFALGHLSIGKEIANLETEKSQEAGACRLFYDQALRQTLRDFDWPFATKIAALNLVEEEPNSEWAYSYRYPTDCLKVRKILSGIRNDTRDTRTPYKIAQDAAAKIILTDKEDAEVEYTVLTVNPAFYPDDFIMALSLRLATYIAPRVTSGDPFKMGDRALGLYRAEIGMAEVVASNEEQMEVEPESEFIRGRE